MALMKVKLFLADHATESYKPFVLTAMYQLYWFYKVLQKTWFHPVAKGLWIRQYKSNKIWRSRLMFSGGLADFPLLN